jgi:hypothetical protein
VTTSAVRQAVVRPGGAGQPAAEGGGNRAGRPRRLWLIVVLQAFLMLGATVLYPAFQNADEASHVDLVIAHRQGQWFAGPGERHYQSGVLTAFGLVPNTQFQTHVGTAAALERTRRQSFDELGTAAAKVPLTNQMVQHPPLYYGLAAGHSLLIPHFSTLSFDQQVFALRLLSLLLLLPVPLLIFSGARRLGVTEDLALVAALLPLGIPTYLRTGASVTNDALLVLTGTALLALLVRVACGDLSRRTAVWVGLIWSAALLTKGFALAFPPAIVMAYLVGSQGGMVARVRAAWQPAMIAGALGVLLGGWWWVRNLVLYGVVQPAGLGEISEPLRQLILGRDRPGGTELGFFGGFFALLGQRVWGSLGLLDVPGLNPALLQRMSITFALVILAALLLSAGPIRRRLGGRLPAGWGPGRAWLLVLPTLLIMGVMYAGSRSVYLHGQQLPGIQVRYLLPVVLGLAVLAAVTMQALFGRLGRWAAPLLLSGIVAFLAVSAERLLDQEMSSRSLSHQTRLDDAVHFIVGWAPFPAAATAMLAVLAAAVVTFTLAAFWSAALRPSQPVHQASGSWRGGAVPSAGDARLVPASSSTSSTGTGSGGLNT